MKKRLSLLVALVMAFTIFCIPGSSAAFAGEEDGNGSTPLSEAIVKAKDSVSYTVSYDANEGTNAPAAQPKTEGETLTLTTQKPTRTGYVFKNWNTLPDGTGTSYAAGGTYTADSDVTLYAQWLNTYKITFNANEGTNAPAAQTKTEGKTLTLATQKPTRTGYVFLRWNTLPDGTGTSYAAGGTYTDNKARTLYAQWRALNKYTVTFNANGGTNPPAEQTKTEGKSLTLTTQKPTRTGYIFTGWNTAKDGSGTRYAAGGTYTANKARTLYAQWKARVVGKIVGNTTPYKKTRNSITVYWKLQSTNKLYTVDKVVIYLNGKVKKTISTSARSGSYTFTGLSDGTYYTFAVKPYYKGKTVTAWKGKALTKAPVQNGAYKPGKYEYYYVKGVKQRNKTIQFKDTRYGTSKYSLYHYYDSNGIFRGRTKAMYNKIKYKSSKKYLIAIDRTNNVMCVYIGGKGKWRPYKYWSCVTGRLKKSDYHATPLGTFTIKSRKLTFSGYGIPEKMKNRYSVWYCSRFKGSIFIHSQLYHYGQKSGFIPGGGTMGTNASHGCVRLNINYARWVYKNCAKGTKVVVMK